MSPIVTWLLIGLVWCVLCIMVLAVLVARLTRRVECLEEILDSLKFEMGQ